MCGARCAARGEPARGASVYGASVCERAGARAHPRRRSPLRAQTEGAAAAALLAHAPGVDAAGREFYLSWYDRIWALCWARFVDHKHGSWFRVLSADLAAVDDLKCPPGKVDYHATGLCYDAADAFEAAAAAAAAGVSVSASSLSAAAAVAGAVP